MPPSNAPPYATTITRASTEHQSNRISYQADGRVFLFLATDDLARDHARFTASASVRPLQDQSYGCVAELADVYGNRRDTTEFAPGHRAA